MLSLDEAIQYAENLGTEEENKIDYDKDSPHMIICRKNTVKDYRQLAEWLRELKERREAITKLSEQISSVKRSVKSENSDYLTGYISALSAVEGMIAKMDGGAENG